MRLLLLLMMICPPGGLLFAGVTPPGDGVDLRFSDRSNGAGLARRGSTYTAAAADFNDDGWPDLAVSNHGSIAIYKNRGDGTFEDVSHHGFKVNGLDTHGIVWLDFDHDKALDLIVVRGGRGGFERTPNFLLNNRGATGFAQVDLPDPLNNLHGRGRSITPWDLNGDGRLDLFVTNFRRGKSFQILALQDNRGGYQDRAEDAGWQEMLATHVAALQIGSRGEFVFVTSGHGWPGGKIHRYSETDGFQEITDSLGISIPRGNRVLKVISGDVDNDGDQDLYYVIGGFADRGAVVIDGVLRFILKAGKKPPLTRRFEFSLSGAAELDFWGDGRHRERTLYLGGDAEVVATTPFVIDPEDRRLAGSPVIDSNGKAGLYLWRDGDRLIATHLGRKGASRTVAGRISPLAGGTLKLLTQSPKRDLARLACDRLFLFADGIYHDATEAAGITTCEDGEDAVMADFDNDGDLDIYVANQGLLHSNPPNKLYQNRGDGRFREVAEESGARGIREGRAASVLTFDYDRDGDLDLFLTNGDGIKPENTFGRYQLLHNLSQGGHWLQVKLIATLSNPAALGARLELRLPSRTIMRQVSSPGGNSSGLGISRLPIHFGFSEAVTGELVVFWPSGRVSRESVRPDTMVTVMEPE